MHQYKQLWDRYLSKVLIDRLIKNQPQVHEDDLLRAKSEVEKTKEAYKKSLIGLPYVFQATIQEDKQKETVFFTDEDEAISYLTLNEDPEDWYEKDWENGPPPFGFMQEMVYRITCMSEVRYVIKQYLV